MMNIFSSIKTTAAEYQMSTGLIATRLYLGHNEVNQVNLAADKLNWVSEDSDSGRMVIMGMKVYEVDAWDHMRTCL